MKQLDVTLQLFGFERKHRIDCDYNGEPPDRIMIRVYKPVMPIGIDDLLNSDPLPGKYLDIYFRYAGHNIYIAEYR